MNPIHHLYVHIPFCRHKCGYCDFNAYAGMAGLMPDYVDALVVELESARSRLPFAPLRTVYLGGGTPSLLPAGLSGLLLRRIREIFEIEAGAEFTLEANPASTDAARVEAWVEGGVNRLSLGVQSFDRQALGVLERRTDGARAVAAYELVRSAGLSNVSLDLIYGVPGQSERSWHDTLARAVELAPEHLSCYCLTFEAGTLLRRRLERGELAEPDPDAQWERLELAARTLEGAGYGRYEVSSWSRPGFESLHNQAYWGCRPVYGAGAGAHSYASDGARAWRWWNIARPREYIATSPQVRVDGEELDPRLARAEALMLGLRTAAGVEAPPGFESELAELEAAGLVIRDDHVVRPTRRGLDLHTQVALAVL